MPNKEIFVYKVHKMSFYFFATVRPCLEAAQKGVMVTLEQDVMLMRFK